MNISFNTNPGKVNETVYSSRDKYEDDDLLPRERTQTVLMNPNVLDIDFDDPEEDNLPLVSAGNNN